MSATVSIQWDAIQAASLAHASRLLPELFPYGKFAGREFQVGSLQGEAGKSLSINTTTGRMLPATRLPS
jgi:hypothetical protein